MIQTWANPRGYLTPVLFIVASVLLRKVFFGTVSTDKHVRRREPDRRLVKPRKERKVSILVCTIVAKGVVEATLKRLAYVVVYNLLNSSTIASKHTKLVYPALVLGLVVIMMDDIAEKDEPVTSIQNCKEYGNKKT